MDGTTATPQKQAAQARRPRAGNLNRKIFIGADYALTSEHRITRHFIMMARTKGAQSHCSPVSSPSVHFSTCPLQFSVWVSPLSATAQVPPIVHRHSVCSTMLVPRTERTAPRRTAPHGRAARWQDITEIRSQPIRGTHTKTEYQVFERVLCLGTPTSMAHNRSPTS